MRGAASNRRPYRDGIDYALPERYQAKISGATSDTETVTSADALPGGPPLWQEIWRDQWGRIAVIVLILAALSAVLVFRDSVARHYRLYRTIRLGFLTVTLLWIGWYAGAQLSVVNVLTFAHSPLMTDFQWEFFLRDPLISFCGATSPWCCCSGAAACSAAGCARSERFRNF